MIFSESEPSKDRLVRLNDGTKQLHLSPESSTAEFHTISLKLQSELDDLNRRWVAMTARVAEGLKESEMSVTESKEGGGVSATNDVVEEHTPVETLDYSKDISHCTGTVMNIHRTSFDCIGNEYS